MNDLKAQIKALTLLQWFQAVVLVISSITLLYIAALVMWSVVKFAVAVLVPLLILGAIGFGLWRIFK